MQVTWHQKVLEERLPATRFDIFRECRVADGWACECDAANGRGRIQRQLLQQAQSAEGRNRAAQ